MTAECCELELYVGDLVQRTHPWDGSARAGMPYGPFLSVKQIFPNDPFAICVLSDNKSEFEFNLKKLEL